MDNVCIATAAATYIYNSIDVSTAKGGGTIVNKGAPTITASGVCWNTTGNPTIAAGEQVDGLFTYDLTGLAIDTKYYVRSYAINEKGVGYGEETIFSTVAEIIIPDNAFITYCLTEFDKNGDGVLLKDEVENVLEISVPISGISSLVGIEYFTSLTKLVCDRNTLKTLDISKNTKLKELRCDGNPALTLLLTHKTYVIESISTDPQTVVHPSY